MLVLAGLALLGSTLLIIKSYDYTFSVSTTQTIAITVLCVVLGLPVLSGLILLFVVSLHLVPM